MRLARWFAGAATVAAVVALTPTAASAWLSEPLPALSSTTLTPGGPAQTRSLTMVGDREFALHVVLAKIDISGLAGVATVEVVSGAGCRVDGTLISCYPAADLQSHDHVATIATLAFRPVAGAAIGATGDVVVKTTSVDFPAARELRSHVTLAEGVALAAGPAMITASARPGGTVSTPLSVRNTGANTVGAVDLFVPFDPWFSAARKYSNCEYADVAAICHFDSDLAPGVTYGTSEPVGITLRKDVPAPWQTRWAFRWRTPADSADDAELVHARGGKAGNQGKLSLVAKPAALSKDPQTNTSGAPDTQTVTVNVTGSQAADLAAVGATVHGKVGATVKVAVGVRNLGPAFVPGPATATVALPRGTTVTLLPVGCRPSAGVYRCTVTTTPFDVGKSVTWTFGLRIDTAGELTGTVTAVALTGDVAGNNTAKVVVNPDGGSLPITGAPVSSVAATGAGLLVAGVIALFIGRRRRTS